MKKSQLSVLKAIAILAISSAGYGCAETSSSNKVEASEVYQMYSVDYSDNTGELSASALFAVGGPMGTTLSLDAPSSVEFNGKSMQKSQLIGTRYSWSDRTDYRGAMEWVYTDRDSKTFRNQIQIVPISFATEPRTLSKRQGLSVQFSGAQLTGEDIVDAKIDFEKDGKSYSARATTRSNQRGNSVVFEPSELTEFPTGSLAKLTLIRERSTKLQENAGKGGSIRSSFEARSVSVEILD